MAGLAALWALVAHFMRSHHAMAMPNPDPSFGGIDAFGSWLFADALVPFELSSALLMVAVLGAVAVAKGRQGTRTLSKSEIEAGRGFRSGDMTTDVPKGVVTSGVFSHEIHLGDGTDNAKETPS